jgi:rhodanese-related sulfurtransferase
MKKSLLTIPAAVLAASLLASQPLTAQEAERPQAATDLVIEAKKSVRLADMETVRQALEGGGYDLLIDVREPSEYASGHLSGAVNIPRGVIEFQIWKHVGYPDATDMTKQIFVACNTGARASLSARSLEDLGFTNVTVVDMKLADWIDSGLPIQKDN